jgi:hypothetical protein
MQPARAASSALLLSLLALAACATGVIDPESSLSTPPSAGAGDAAPSPEAKPQGEQGEGKLDAGLAPTRDAGPGKPSDATAADAAPSFAKDAGSDGPLALAACTTLFINEVQVAGSSASDELVELYNPGAACTFAGWKLVYRAATGTSDGVMFQGAVTLAAGGFAVIGGSGFAGPKAGTIVGGLAAAGGQLQLRDGADVVKDSMGYGNASGAFVRGTAAPAPPAGSSVARTPDGASTGDNAADFTIVTPTPGASNAP